MTASRAGRAPLWLLCSSAFAFSLGCSTPRVGVLEPEPRPADDPGDAETSLLLSPSVPDRFALVVAGSDVEVVSWRETLENGFEAGFSRDARGASSEAWILRLERADLEIIRGRATSAGGRRYALAGEFEELAHGAPHSAPPGAPKRQPFYATVSWEASIVGPRGDELARRSGLAESRRPVAHPDARALGAIITSAVEVMIEQMRTDLVATVATALRRRRDDGAVTTELTS